MSENLQAENSMSYEDKIVRLRKMGKALTKEIRDMMIPELYNEEFTNKYPEADVAEMKANVMLAVRHSEDCRMRAGKVLQALNGGVSPYDK